MKKLVPGIIICIFCMAATGWACWWGFVKWSDTGQGVGKRATVIAIGFKTPNVYTLTNTANGGYNLTSLVPNGMVVDSQYVSVNACMERDGKMWYGIITNLPNGGIFTQTPSTQLPDIYLYPGDCPW